MIAAVAARTNASLLATDVDVHRIAQVVGIELDGMSPGRL
jgi:predicted nucleic acid-binding protein